MKFLEIFKKVWICLVLILIALSIFGTYTSTQSLSATFDWVLTTFSPFNIWNFILMVLLISPVIVADHFINKWKMKRVDLLVDSLTEEDEKEAEYIFTPHDQRIDDEITELREQTEKEKEERRKK